MPLELSDHDLEIVFCALHAFEHKARENARAFRDKDLSRGDIIRATDKEATVTKEDDEWVVPMDGLFLGSEEDCAELRSRLTNFVGRDLAETGV